MIDPSHCPQCNGTILDIYEITKEMFCCQCNKFFDFNSNEVKRNAENERLKDIKPLSKKVLTKDNTEMLGQLKYCQRVIQNLEIKNIELALENERLKREFKRKHENE